MPYTNVFHERFSLNKVCQNNFNGFSTAVSHVWLCLLYSELTQDNSAMAMSTIVATNQETMQYDLVLTFRSRNESLFKTTGYDYSIYVGTTVKCVNHFYKYLSKTLILAMDYLSPWKISASDLFVDRNLFSWELSLQIPRLNCSRSNSKIMWLDYKILKVCPTTTVTESKSTRETVQK